MKSFGLYYIIAANTSSIKLRMVFLLIFINYVVCLDFSSTVLEEDSKLLDFKDNDDINYIATTKKIYSGLVPQNIVTFSQEISSNVVFSRYENSSYLVASCTMDYMLSYFLSGSPIEKRIYGFSSSNVASTNDTCSVSFLLSYAYILHTKIEGSSIVLTLVKQKLSIYSSSGLGVYSSPFTIHTTLSLNTPENFPYISCESILVIDNDNDAVLICSFINIDSRNNSIYKYVASTGNYTSTYKLNENVELFQSDTLKYFRIQRINTTFIRYFFGSNTYEIYLTKENGKYVFNIVPEESRNQYLYSFYSYKDLYYYNKEFIFHATPSDETNLNFNLYITNNISSNNLITIINNKPIEKVAGYYDKEADKFIYIYQYSNKIEYFIIEQKCLYNAWHINSDGSFNCYDDKNYCQANEYYYHTNTRECVLSSCRSGYYRLNFECYKGGCPENTELVSSDGNECESTLDYCYLDSNYKTHCSNEPIGEYIYKYENTKIYLKTCDDSYYFFGINTYLYQNTCLYNCPSQTTANFDSGKCECNFFIYYSNSERSNYYCLLETETCEGLNKYNIPDINECVDTKQECIDRSYKIFDKQCLNTCPINTIQNGNNCECEFHFYKESETLHCFEEEKTCENIGYPTTSNTNECFLSKDDCIQQGNKYFNNVCYINTCPSNTYEKNNDGICHCSFFYYYDKENDLYTCFEENDTCESKLYSYENIESKHCFSSLDDCKEKGFYVFNNECHTSCPENTINNINDNYNCICQNYFFLNDEENIYDCFSSDKICITANSEYQYTNIETKECFKTKESCEQESNGIEKCKYYDSCDPSKDFMFNGVCYKTNCPQGTILDTSNPSSRNCVCKENSKIDPITGLTTCIETFPEEHYSNQAQCPFIYEGNCVLECPENTCLNPNLNELINCINVTDNMKVYNGICIEGINELISKIVSNDNYTEIKPIFTPSGTIINTYPTEASKDDLISNFPNLTYVDLGECEDKLKEEYNLTNDTKLYILGIDTPNLSRNSSINVFNFEIYLKNGTQINYLSACNESKIITSSNINDLNIIRYDKAKKFSDVGYDIYNRTDRFYVDNCASANDNGNDITLKDREKYYYPNVSICNEGCDYYSIDFESQRFICECDVMINISYTDSDSTNDESKDNEKDDQTYGEYFLSLINYKIFKCYALFNKFENYYYNGGLYIGIGTLLISTSLIFVFCFKTVNIIKIDLFKNLPTTQKLKEGHRTNMKHNTIDRLKINNESNTINNNNNPPRKNKKNNIINLLFFGSNKNKNSENEIIKSIDINNNDTNNDKVKNNQKTQNKVKKKYKTLRIPKKKFTKVINDSSQMNKTKEQDKVENSSNIKLKSPKIMAKLNRNTTLKKITLNKQKTSKFEKENDDINNNNNLISEDIDEELNIDFNFTHLIDIRDEEIDRKELNEIPYQQALRIDNRNFFEIALTVFINKVGILNLLFYRTPYTYLSLTVTVYLFEFLLDLTINCFLYSDDVVSEKYHNDGSLTMFTSFTLSIISNIVSSIITALVSNLTDFNEILEAIIINVKYQKKYLENIIRFMKYIKVRLTLFYLFQISFIFLMTYYLFILSAVYHHSQISIMINYIIGALTSLAVSTGLTLIISILRVLSLKYHSYELFNTSKYLYKKF